MSYKSIKDVVTMLQENGFVLKSQKGSHMKFEKDDKIVIVPNHMIRYNNYFVVFLKLHMATFLTL